MDYCKGKRGKLKFKKEHPEAIIPQYAKYGDSGFDFYALVENEKDNMGNDVDFFFLYPEEQKLV
ncbi:MAG: hypothetical protein ACOCRX_05930, partial [Candidatus Woesearchaeota archaeon]